MTTSKTPRQEKYPDTRFDSDLPTSTSNAAGILLLDALWRSPDLFRQIGSHDRQNNIFENLPVSGVADAVALALKLSGEGVEAYFACAEYLSPDSRKAANVSGAYAFWVDVDCSEDKATTGKGYASIEAAEEALIEFCKVTGLPEPTHVIYTGGGLHAYWVLDGMTDRDTWQSYAKKLKALTKACVFLADDSRTADIASVLRVPGTHNHKYSPPRPVALKYASTEFIERSVMFDAITDAHDRLCRVTTIKPPGRPSAASTSTTTLAGASIYGPPDIEKLSSALAMLDPDCDEETWKLYRLAPLALAARNYPDYSAELYELTRSWSSGELCGKASMAWTTPGGNGLTGEEVFDSVWQRFLDGNYSGTPVTLGTIYYDAMQVGWDPEDQFQVVDGTDEGDA